MCGGVPTPFSMANTLPKLKKSSSWMVSSVSKEEVFLHSRPLARNRTKQILRCNNQANEASTAPSLKPVKALSQMRIPFWSKTRLLTHFLRSIPTWTLTLSTRVPSAIVNSLPSLQRRTRKLKKEHILCCEDSTLLPRHSGTQKRVGRTKQKDQIDNETRLIWKVRVLFYCFAA